MKKKILSFVSVCLLIASLTISAFASYNASNVEIEAGSNKTNVTVDALLDFIYSKGGREATDSEMQQISDKINEINALNREMMQPCIVPSNRQIQLELAGPGVKFCVSDFRQSQEWRWKAGRILA